ncbi:MAG: PDZ domain-containing protein [Sphingopyxis sp.]|nr:PDZ domain-containing protein [Sphingopyxis sp.]
MGAGLPFRIGLLRVRWPALLLGLLAALLLVQAVRLLWAVAVPPGPLGQWQYGSAQLLTAAEGRNLFASLDPFFRSVAAGTTSANVTALDLKLFGINLNEAAGTGSAIIAGSDGVQSSYAVGDEIQPGVTLAGVAFDHVLIDRGGARESLFLDQSAGTGSAPGTAAPVPLTNVAPSANGQSAGAAGEIGPQALQAGVSFAPRSEGGTVTGLTVQPMGDGAIFRAAGLKPGDVVRSVNGRPIATAADVASQITPGARLSLDVERGSAVVPVALFIGK